jgi:hypothetical protein
MKCDRISLVHMYDSWIDRADCRVNKEATFGEQIARNCDRADVSADRLPSVAPGLALIESAEHANAFLVVELEER